METIHLQTSGGCYSVAVTLTPVLRSLDDEEDARASGVTLLRDNNGNPQRDPCKDNYPYQISKASILGV